MSERAGAIHLRDVVKGFHAYHSRSTKELLLRLVRRERLFDRRAILRGLSLDIAPGERVAIIGRNGAGKSTLFRLMCGILEPESGVITVAGRVSPLIEITAGLVPDLSGAENIRLNASLLGLSNKEIARRFDDIVAFAELGDFLETPVRYFSSGMQARLGFSVAVHVDADILLVDEVLAVGDQAFQERCLQRMTEVSNGGATVVFVSHELADIERFCERALWIADGVVVFDGPPVEAHRRMMAAIAVS